MPGARSYIGGWYPQCERQNTEWQAQRNRKPSSDRRTLSTLLLADSLRCRRWRLRHEEEEIDRSVSEESVDHVAHPVGRTLQDDLPEILLSGVGTNSTRAWLSQLGRTPPIRRTSMAMLRGSVHRMGVPVNIDPNLTRRKRVKGTGVVSYSAIVTEPKNESAPDSMSQGRSFDQPSPESCSQPPYVLTFVVGMAPTGYCGNAAWRGCGSIHRVTSASWQQPSNGHRYSPRRDSLVLEMIHRRI